MNSTTNITIDKGTNTVNRKHRYLSNIKRTFTGYSMILPAMIFFFLFLVFPLLKAVHISFFDYAGVGKMTDFIGLSNYIKSFTDLDFYSSLLRTVKLTAVDITVSITIGFFLAYTLYKRVGGWRFFSVALYIPSIITVVVAGLIWRQIFEPNQGLLNSLLQTMGLDGLKRIWIGDVDMALGSVTVAWIWRTIPFNMIIIYSAILSVPEELFESAKMDGATELNIIKSIIIPSLIPTLSILAVYAVATDFRSFDMVQVLTAGGPGKATEIITLYVYRLVSALGEYGYANAIAVESFILVGVMVLLIFTLLKKLGLLE